MNVRAKFYVNSVTKYQEPAGTGQVTLNAVYQSKPGVDGNACEENYIFGKYTPSGTINMGIQNPPAFKFFEDALEAKRPVYVDFSLADN